MLLGVPEIRLSAAYGMMGRDKGINWYNNRLRGGTRNETRVTGFGGTESPLLDPDNTGAIALLFYTKDNNGWECYYWVCQNASEEDTAEDFAGPVEPGRPRCWSTSGSNLLDDAEAVPQSGCWLTLAQITAEWADRFPTPQEIIDKAISLQGYRGLSVDSRLLKRRDCEYDVFRSVEQAFELPAIQHGFESIGVFVNKANTILQRRKSRAGRSLELQMKAILEEESVKCEFQARTEAKNRPDFIFPSQEAYNNPSYPDSQLRMLAVKTTVRERWRQILEEADRISVKHLLTLQEGVSEQQFSQMRNAGVRLVVPESLHTRYPASVRPEILTLQNFIKEVQTI